MSIEELWKKHAVEWETNRYSSIYSSLIYGSLKNRMNYLRYIIEQLQDNTHVMEVGCGSGRLFNLLYNKNKLNYSGVDISAIAIESAKNLHKDYKNAVWDNCSVEQLSDKQVEIVISAGLLDWLTDDQIKKMKIINSKYFIHSFSLSQNSYRTFIHNIFCKIISIFKKISYKPRKFTLSEMRELFAGEEIKIITDPYLPRRLAPNAVVE